MRVFYIYRDVNSYAIFSSHNKTLLGEYSSDARFYYFAAFTRAIDAADYLKNLEANRK